MDLKKRKLSDDIKAVEYIVPGLEIHKFIAKEHLSPYVIVMHFTKVLNENMATGIGGTKVEEAFHEYQT